MKKACTVAIMMFALLTIAGCWDNKELDTLSIVTGVGIDASEQADEAEYTFQVGKLSQGDSSKQEESQQSDTSFLLKAKKRGVFESIKSLSNENSRELFLHHNQVIIFGYEQAEKGMNPYIDAFIREREMRMESWILIADGNAGETLSVNMEQEKISALGIDLIMENMAQTSKSQAVCLLDFTSKILDKPTSPVAPIIKRIQEENEKEMLIISGMAVFKDDKLIGRLTEEQVKGYSWVMGDTNYRNINVSTEYGYANLKMQKISIKKKPIFKNEKPAYSIAVSGKLGINELQGFEDMEPYECYSILEKATIGEIEKEIMNCFETAKQLKADVFGIGTAFYRHYPKQWKTMKNDWDSIFSEVEIIPEIAVNLVDTGKIMNSLELKGMDEDES